MNVLPPERPLYPAPPLPMPPPTPGATRAQRIALFAGVFVALLAALWVFSPILTPFVLAAVIAYFLDPLADRLTRVGMPRGLAAILLVLGLVALAFLMLLLLYPLLISQVTILLQRLPAYVLGIGKATRDAVEALAERFPDVFDARLQELAVGQAGAIISYLGTSAARLLGGGVAVFHVFTYVTVTPVVCFYLLRDWPSMVRRVDGWLPRRSAASIREITGETDRVLSAWLRGQLLCCALLAVYYAVALTAIRLELGLTVGLMAGILSFIPYVGSITGLITALALALAQFGNSQGVLLVLGIFLVGQIVEGYVIYPRLLGDRVELHAVWVIFALFAGGIAFGFLGVLLAVPLAAVIGVILRHWLQRYLESPLYHDPPHEPG